VADGDQALAALDGIERAGGFWAGWLGYDLGRVIEPITLRRAADRAVPDVAFVRYGSVVAVGASGSVRRVHGRASAPPSFECRPGATGGAPPGLGPMQSSLSRHDHAHAVGAIKDLLVAGDCYQVNLTRRLHSERAAEPRDLFAALARVNPAPHAALVSCGDVAVVSASPERFLRLDGDLVETAPIKGTHVDAAVLARSAKDAAEHVMIVDLARNDLGRVAEYGSVHVGQFASMEAHPGLHHLVSRVRARLRPDVTLGALVGATFPPASVTGAPKPRVLQAIEDLEPVRRGIYCGAVGWIDADRRRADLNVAIRTFTITPAGTDLGVGGGIVIDSCADSEWHETTLKACRLLRAAGAVDTELAGARR